MIIHDNVEQNSLDWLKLHIGIPTASAFDNLVKADFSPRTGEMPRTYLYKKVAELWRGQPLGDFSTFATEQGHIVEEEARPFFELETNQKVRQVGFITNDDKTAGCSPDGLIVDTGADCGLEIKCPAAHTHVKYLLEGKLPAEYAAQVHGSMYVTGYDRWMFMSYRRKFPPLILEVQRDEEIITKIHLAVNKFTEEIEAAREQIAQMDKR